MPAPGARAEDATATPPSAGPAAPPSRLPTVNLPEKPILEPKAMEILKAMGDRLAAAHSMTFTALATYESPAVTGQPLAYTSLFEVALQRPDKLRVISPGDGPATEFYYDGKTMMAYAPAANLVAVDQAPATIDAMLELAFQKAAIYFPFTDAIVADPYKDLSRGLRLAFYVGQSHVVGGTVTDIVAVATDTVQAEFWIGAEDHLPRLARATFFNEPGNFRHVVEMSDWKLDPKLAASDFTSEKALKAPRIKFESPDAKLPQPN
ncbi:MAG: DUF2092 domain-containing protein [Dongiaceae bacterium]